jgi:hypothetical protein
MPFSNNSRSVSVTSPLFYVLLQACFSTGEYITGPFDTCSIAVFSCNNGSSCGAAGWVTPKVLKSNPTVFD